MEAARLLWENWDTGILLEDLRQHFCLEEETDGHAIQKALPAIAEQPHAGWKIAATSLGGQKHINVNGPISGRLLSGRILAEGEECSLAANSMGVMEAEFAFRFGETVPLRDSAYTPEEVLARVSELRLAIELPDSRFKDFTSVGKAHLVADNACAWWLLEGRKVESGWRETDLSDHVVNVFLNGKLAAEGRGSNVLGDPRKALAWLVNDVTSRGETIGKGELVTTGTCIIPVPVKSGDQVLADFGSFGTVEIRFNG